ncbi:hypothetical protein CFP66_33825 [Pseudonocardia sp. MH-G8]|nr:hypothetical protein CFP66_33825 [Pseudonocardia sp. MH-G8]
MSTVSRAQGQAGGPAAAVILGIVRPHTVAWGLLWFLVVVAFTAGVGVIQAAGAAGEMPPLTSSVEVVVDDGIDQPSSAPTPDVLSAE